MRYLPLAAEDLRAQVEYYAAKAPGLDKLFLSAIRQTERLILSNPDGFPRVEEASDTRAVVVRRFPFRILFAVRNDSVIVTAVAHTAREPSRFSGRRL